MHYAIGKRISQIYDVTDRERFCFGNLYPDACPGEKKQESHLMETGKDGLRYYNLTKFRERYLDLMREDPLVLGYYIHIVEDMIFRKFLQNVKRYKKVDKYPVIDMYHDYNNVNGFLVQKYELPDEIEIPDFIPDFIDVKLHPDFIAATYKRFTKMPQEGECILLDEALTDQYINTAIFKCTKELLFLRDGGSGMCESMVRF